MSKEHYAERLKARIAEQDALIEELRRRVVGPAAEPEVTMHPPPEHRDTPDLAQYARKLTEDAWALAEENRAVKEKVDALLAQIGSMRRRAA